MCEHQTQKSELSRVELNLLRLRELAKKRKSHIKGEELMTQRVINLVKFYLIGILVIITELWWREDTEI